MHFFLIARCLAYLYTVYIYISLLKIKLLMLLCKFLIFVLLFICFTLRFYTAGIYSGQQGKNFIAQGNKLSNCAHDDKHLKKDGGSLHVTLV